MPINAIDSASQAMRAVGTDMQVRADNIANVSTEEFNASRTTFETGPEGQGVQVQDVVEISSQGPLVPSLQVEEVSPGVEEPVPAFVEGSNTDIASEMTGMIRNEATYAANAAVVRTQDEMVGQFINSMV